MYTLIIINTISLCSDDDDDAYIPPFINPPPSISTTAFPTVANTSIPESTRYYCQFVPDVPTAEPTVASTNRPSTAYPTTAQSTAISFKAKQVYTTTLCILLHYIAYLYCILYS